VENRPNLNPSDVSVESGERELEDDGEAILMPPLAVQEDDQPENEGGQQQEQEKDEDEKCEDEEEEKDDVVGPLSPRGDLSFRVSDFGSNNFPCNDFPGLLVCPHKHA